MIEARKRTPALSETTRLFRERQLCGWLGRQDSLWLSLVQRTRWTLSETQKRRLRHRGPFLCPLWV